MVLHAQTVKADTNGTRSGTVHGSVGRGVVGYPGSTPGGPTYNRCTTPGVIPLYLALYNARYNARYNAGSQCRVTMPGHNAGSQWPERCQMAKNGVRRPRTGSQRAQNGVTTGSERGHNGVRTVSERCQKRSVTVSVSETRKTGS